MRKCCLATMALLVTLLTGCGQSHEARGLTKKFMATQMGISDYDVIQWGTLDSTFFVSDSMVSVMRQQMAGKVKGGYATPSSKLLYLNVKYAIDKDTIKQTFYFDDKMTGVVSLKNS